MNTSDVMLSNGLQIATKEAPYKRYDPTPPFYLAWLSFMGLGVVADWCWKYLVPFMTMGAYGRLSDEQIANHNQMVDNKNHIWRLGERAEVYTRFGEL